ncbi:MAG: hypothetical protein GF311_02900 [Candidatus Lokiarchaeota archaeon]|nr:hypothetical protein [Candidatus Lokiarchaeota archaeon]
MSNEVLIIFILEFIIGYLILTLKKKRQELPFQKEFRKINQMLGNNLNELDTLRKGDNPEKYFKKAEQILKDAPEEVLNLTSPKRCEQIIKEHTFSISILSAFKRDPVFFVLYSSFSIMFILPIAELFLLFQISYIINPLIVFICLIISLGFILSIQRSILDTRLKERSYEIYRINNKRNVNRTRNKVWEMAHNFLGIVDVREQFNKYYEPEIPKRVILMIKLTRLAILFSFCILIYLIINSLLNSHPILFIFQTSLYFLSLMGYYISIKTIRNQRFENFTFFFICLGLIALLDNMRTFNLFYLVFSILLFLTGIIAGVTFQLNRQYRVTNGKNSIIVFFHKNWTNIVGLSFLFIDLRITLLFCLNLGKFQIFNLTHWISLIFLIASIKSFRRFLSAYRNIFKYESSYLKREVLSLVLYSTLSILSCNFLASMIGPSSLLLLASHNIIQLIIPILESLSSVLQSNKEQMVGEKPIVKAIAVDKPKSEEREQSNTHKTIVKEAHPILTLKEQIHGIIEKTEEIFHSQGIPLFSTDKLGINDAPSLFKYVGCSVVLNEQNHKIINIILIAFPQKKESQPSLHEFQNQLIPSFIQNFHQIFLNWEENSKLKELIKYRIISEKYHNNINDNSLREEIDRDWGNISLIFDSLYITQNFQLYNASQTQYPYFYLPNLHVINTTLLSKLLSYLNYKYIMLENVKRYRPTWDTIVVWVFWLVFSIRIILLIYLQFISYFSISTFSMNLFILLYVLVIILNLCSIVGIFIGIYYRKKRDYVPFHLKNPHIHRKKFEEIIQTLAPNYKTQLIAELPFLQKYLGNQKNLFFFKKNQQM